MANWLAPNPFENRRELTKTEARGLRRMYLSAGLATPVWDVLHFQTVQDKFGGPQGQSGFRTVDGLVRDGFLRKDGAVWRITSRGKEAFQRYVQKHGMPAR